MKRVLRGTHWTACANFLHPILKCVCYLKPSFYKSSIHLETSVIWLQVINTILGSAWVGGWRGSLSIAIGLAESTLIWSPTWNRFFHVLEKQLIQPGWGYLLIISLHTFLLCLIKLETRSSIAELRPGSMLCIFGFAEGLSWPCNNHNAMSSPPGTAGGIEKLVTLSHHICNTSWNRSLFTLSQALACKLMTNIEYWNMIPEMQYWNCCHFEYIVLVWAFSSNFHFQLFFSSWCESQA